MNILDMIVNKQPMEPSGMPTNPMRPSGMPQSAPATNDDSRSFGQRMGDFFSDPDKVSQFIMALTPMMSPWQQKNPAVQLAQANVLQQRKDARLTKEQNKTIEFLKARGVDPKLLEQAKGNPDLISALLTKAFESPDKPSVVQEYEYARNQGFEGTLTDFVASKRAPQDTYELLTPEQKTALGLDPTKLYQRSKLTNQVVGEGGTNINLPSEGERKTGVLANRLATAQEQVKAALTVDPEAESPELFPTLFSKAGMDTLARALTSDQRQIVESAQLDMLDAALTLGTGAAYTKEQLEGYRNSYFPQIGDSDQTIKAKRMRLEQLISTANQAAGRGQITSISQISPNKASVSGNVVVFPDGSSYVFPDSKSATQAANEFNGGN